MRELEQYSDENFVVKCIYKGQQSEAILLFLKPGQEMPSHSHKYFEVVLVPQKGRGVMSVNSVKEVDLFPETLYYEPAGCTFRIRNTGDAPLQILITLIRVEQRDAILPVSTDVCIPSSDQLEYKKAALK